MHETTENDGADACALARDVAATSVAGATVARLLASTIEVVTDFDGVRHEPALMRVVRDAARALDGVSGEREPENVTDALDALGIVVAALPMGIPQPGEAEGLPA